MKRTEQREHIFKLIFGADFNEESEQGTQTELYLEQIEGATEKDMQYISQKAQKIIEKIDEIDTLINEHTTGWKTGRMNKTCSLRDEVGRGRSDRCCDQRSCQSCKEIQQ